MSKLNLNDITSGFGSKALHNTNNGLIEDAIENTLSRDGTTPNSMEADLDMNSHSILNLPTATQATEPVTYGQWTNGAISVTFSGTTRETFTATAGQTAFTLIGVTYTPGASNLNVYINGVRQTASEYTETSGTVFTFGTGLDAGDTVEAVVNERPVSADVVSGLSVTFLDSFPGSVQTNVQQQLREILTYIRGYGTITTDLEDVTAAINTSDDKAIGWRVFNSTTNKPVYATGSAAADAWVDATGATVHTPV